MSEKVCRLGSFLELEKPDEPERPVGILTAAALTYLAASLASLLNLWRWIAFLWR